MPLRRVVILLVVCAAACSRGNDPNGASDGGTDPGGPAITVTTRAPALTYAPAEKASATWAAYRLDESEWSVLAATSPGTYVFPLPRARWSIALACATDDGGYSTVFIHHRTSATTSLDVSLEEQCTLPPPAADYTLVGNITNTPATAQWLDFGYALDSRGVALNLPTAGASAYELVGIEPGTWDLTFGIRDEPSRALTRVLIRRAEVMSSDRTMDVDIIGPGSFVPAQKPLVLHGVGVGDSVAPTILYGAGGPSGIDVGPQDVPPDQTDVTLAYSVFPDGTRLPGDRYHGAMHAEHDRRSDSRKITFDFHQAIDLDLTLLPPLAEPVLRVVGTSPQVRIETKLALLPNAMSHEVHARSMENRRTQHAWRTTYDAAIVGGAAELVDEMPDLSSLPGWQSSWGLLVGTPATVFTTAYEVPRPLGDGTMQRTTAKASSIVP